MKCEPIGTIRTPFTEIADMPVQPTGADGVAGRIELRADLVEGLCDLDGFSHIIVLYRFHRAPAPNLTVTPFLDKQPRGLFATRAPCRPNPIGLSILKLARIDGATLFVENVDMLDGTPLLDIKPYVPAFDRPAAPIRAGWLENGASQVKAARSDDRFKQG